MSKVIDFQEYKSRRFPKEIPSSNLSITHSFSPQPPIRPQPTPAEISALMDKLKKKLIRENDLRESKNAYKRNT